MRVNEMLDNQRVMVLATLGESGLPHLVPMWFARREHEIIMLSYGKSLKVRNLRRDPRAVLLVEAGHDYFELKGVSLDCTVELIEDTAAVEKLGLEISARYEPNQESSSEKKMTDMVRDQAPRRVALIFTPTRTRSWDHRQVS